jgi:hypothetical protein
LCLPNPCRRLGPNMRALITLVALLALSSCVTPRGARDTMQWRALVEQNYVVVTLRNRPTPAPRAGSGARGYELASIYGPSAAARRDAQRIANQYSLREVDAWAIQVLDVHCVVYAVDHSKSAEAVLARLRVDRRVESAQPLYSFNTLSSETKVYSDPYYRLQSNLQAMQVPQAQLVARGAGVRVAIIDTGIAANHPDLVGRVAVHRDFVAGPSLGERHGTAVAGIIAARDNNAQGIVGIAPDSQLLSLRACWQMSADEPRALCNTFTLAQALAAAIELRADVVNLSLAGPIDPLLDRLVNAGAAQGIVYVGAISPLGASFPTSNRNVMAVQGVNASVNGGASLRAPGDNVLTLTPVGYDFLHGSSMATASVSAAVALIRSYSKSVDRGRIYDALKNTMGNSIAVCDALDRLQGAPVCQTK